MSDTESTDESVESPETTDIDASENPEISEEAPTENKDTPKVKKHFGKRLLKLTVVLVVLFFLGIWVLPVGLRLGAEYWLRSQGQADADIGDIDFNPFTGRIIIKTLDTSGEQGDELTMSEAELRLRYKDLLKKRIYIEKFSLSDVGLDVVVNEDGSLVIGGLPIVAPEAAAESDAEPWGFGLGGIELSNVTIRYSDPTLKTDVLVNSVSVAEMKSWDAEVATAIDMALIVNDGSVDIKGTMSPFRSAPKVDLTLGVEDLSLNFLEPLLAEQVDSIAGDLSVTIACSAEIDPANEQITLKVDGGIELKNLTLAMAPTSVRMGQLGWLGSLELSGSLGNPSILFSGETAIEKSELLLESERYRVEYSAMGWDGTVEVLQGESPILKLAGDLKVGDITVADRDLSSQSFSANDLNISDTELAMDIKTQDLQGKSTIKFGDVKLTLDSMGAGALKSDVTWDGTVEFWDDIKTSLDIDTQISIDDLDINDISDEQTEINFVLLEVLAKSFSIDSTPKEHLFKLTGGIGLADTLVTPVDSLYTISQLQTDWQGVVTATEVDESVILRAEGDIKVQDTNVSEVESGRTLAEVLAIQVSGLIFEDPDAVQFETAVVTQLSTLERAKQESSPVDALDRIARIETIELANVKMNASSLDAERISLTSVSSWLERDTEGAMEMSTWFGVEAAVETDAAEVAAPIVEEDGEAFSIRVGQFDLKGTNTVVFRDTSVNPSVRIDLNELLVSLGDLNTGAPEALSPLKVSAKLGKYSSISSEGKFAPLADNLSANMKTSIKQIDLSPLTSYSERFIGYRLKSGVFNGDFDVNIDQGKLDTQNGILLNQLAMERLSEDEKDQFAEQVGYSVNTALSLLRDNNGDIELSIPVSGSLDDPDISIADILQTATFNAVKGSVLVVFKPLGAIFDKSNFLKFDPLTFDVGSAKLPDDVRKKLTDVSKLLKNKPGIRLTLCGVTTTADANFMLEKKKAELPPPPVKPEVVVTPEDIFLGNPEKLKAKPADEGEAVATMETVKLTDEEMLTLSQQRGEAVKDFLVNEGGVDPERLILCSPGVDKKDDAKPRVDFSL